jgi:hypothetical protein
MDVPGLWPQKIIRLVLPEAFRELREKVPRLLRSKR